MYFRADKRDFSVRDTIQSAGQFQELNPEGTSEIETIFEQTRPSGKPQRIGSLYLFIDERAAKKHWSKMTGGKLYTVHVKDLSCIHQGDMSLVNMAYECRNEAAQVEQLALQYWAGNLTASPIVEVLVQSAIIAGIISKDEIERRAYFKSWALG